MSRMILQDEKTQMGLGAMILTVMPYGYHRSDYHKKSAGSEPGILTVVVLELGQLYICATCNGKMIIQISTGQLLV